MNKTQQNRLKRLMPNNQPRYVRVYDLGPEQLDRYTIVFQGNHRQGYPYVSSGVDPRGFYQHGEGDSLSIDRKRGQWPPSMGRKNHLGTRIPFSELPISVRHRVLEDYASVWRLDEQRVLEDYAL